MKNWRYYGLVAFLIMCLIFSGTMAQMREHARERQIHQLEHQLTDVVRFVQGAQRTEIQQAGARVRTPPPRPRIDPPWVRAMDAWYRDAGLQPSPEGDRLVWHERRLDELEARVRALEGACGRATTRRTP